MISLFFINHILNATYKIQVETIQKPMIQNVPIDVLDLEYLTNKELLELRLVKKYFDRVALNSIRSIKVNIKRSNIPTPLKDRYKYIVEQESKYQEICAKAFQLLQKIHKLESLSIKVFDETYVDFQGKYYRSHIYAYDNDFNNLKGIKKLSTDSQIITVDQKKESFIKFLAQLNYCKLHFHLLNKKKLINILQHCVNIKKLKINCLFHNEDDYAEVKKYMNKLCNFITNSSCLEELDFTFLHLDHQSIFDLNQALKNNQTLKGIKLNLWPDEYYNPCYKILEPLKDLKSIEYIECILPENFCKMMLADIFPGAEIEEPNEENGLEPVSDYDEGNAPHIIRWKKSDESVKLL